MMRRAFRILMGVAAKNNLIVDKNNDLFSLILALEHL